MVSSSACSPFINAFTCVRSTPLSSNLPQELGTVALERAFVGSNARVVCASEPTQDNPEAKRHRLASLVHLRGSSYHRKRWMRSWVIASGPLTPRQCVQDRLGVSRRA